MKTVTEISLELPNVPGAAARIVELLAGDGISIVALSVQAHGEKGAVALVAVDTPRAVKLLESAGYAPSERQILAAEVPSHPGGLNTILKVLAAAGLNIDRLYLCLPAYTPDDRTIAMLAVDNPSGVHDIFFREWIRLYGEELFSF